MDEVAKQSGRARLLITIGVMAWLIFAAGVAFYFFAPSDSSSSAPAEAPAAEAAEEEAEAGDGPSEGASFNAASTGTTTSSLGFRCRRHDCQYWPAYSRRRRGGGGVRATGERAPRRGAHPGDRGRGLVAAGGYYSCECFFRVAVQFPDVVLLCPVRPPARPARPGESDVGR